MGIIGGGCVTRHDAPPRPSPSPASTLCRLHLPSATSQARCRLSGRREGRLPRRSPRSSTGDSARTCATCAPVSLRTPRSALPAHSPAPPPPPPPSGLLLSCSPTSFTLCFLLLLHHSSFFIPSITNCFLQLFYIFT